jgi:ABC-type amino acid transport substrate-binding protein
MRKIIRAGGRAAAVAALLAAALLAAPGTAAADRCQPEELLGAGWQIMPEADNPVCIVVIDGVYPALACDYTTLRRCLDTLDPVATVQKAPYTAAQTPGRVAGMPPKITQGLLNQVRGSCTGMDIRFIETYLECRIAEARRKLPPS